MQEFRRNREKKIDEALRRFCDQKLNLSFPQVCKDYSEYAKLQSLQREYERCHGILLEKLEKELAIADLRDSGNFRRTHSVIAKLRQYDEFTPAQVDDIATAALDNPQVRWIISDPDVRALLTDILNRYGDRLNEDKKNKRLEALG